MSLLLRLDEHTFHALSVITRSIQRVLADIVTVTLKPINSIQINNLRPVDAHEIRMLRQHLLNPPQPMVHHQALPVGQEHDTPILEGSHPQNLVIPHLLPLLISLHEEAIPKDLGDRSLIFLKKKRENGSQSASVFSFTYRWGQAPVIGFVTLGTGQFVTRIF